MGPGLAPPHGQRCVQKQHPLIRPGFQTAVGRDGDAQIPDQLPEDVLQRWRLGHPSGHGKGQAVGLPRPVVGILPQEHHLGLGVGSALQRFEDLVHIGVDRAVAVLLDQKLPQGQVVFLAKFPRQKLIPVIAQMHCH